MPLHITAGVAAVFVGEAVGVFVTGAVTAAFGAGATADAAGAVCAEADKVITESMLATAATPNPKVVFFITTVVSKR
jgi:hypothetical protein